MDDRPVDRVVIDADPRLAARVGELSRARMVFVAGLPGTGKSLLVHQLVHVARGVGRGVHLVQWDVARPAFEASPEGRRYPLTDGVTHPMIRRAAGLWVRHALVAWSERHRDALLIGEVPCVGGRFIELARPDADRAEVMLAAPECRFALAVPSTAVRHFLEGERERRATRPLHPREREDAPPHVLRDLWRELVAAARALGVGGAPATPTASAGPADVPIPYDPDVYRRVYEAVLRHRHVEAIALDVILPTGRLSVYDFAVAPPELIPTEAEADGFVRAAERRHPDPVALARAAARWWQV